MRKLPVYRFINHRVEILGLSLYELIGLSISLVVLVRLLAFLRHGALISLATVLVVALTLRILNASHQRHFLRRLIRFIQLPDCLFRRIEDEKLRRSR